PSPASPAPSLHDALPICNAGRDTGELALSRLNLDSRTSQGAPVPDRGPVLRHRSGSMLATVRVSLYSHCVMKTSVRNTTGMHSIDRKSTRLNSSHVKSSY